MSTDLPVPRDQRDPKEKRDPKESLDRTAKMAKRDPLEDRETPEILARKAKRDPLDLPDPPERREPKAAATTALPPGCPTDINLFQFSHVDFSSAPEFIMLQQFFIITVSLSKLS